LIGNRRIDWDTGWNTFDGKIFEYLEGWFLAATNDVWKSLGYFDPSYAPYDMEDIDIATTAKVHNYNLISLNNPYLVHLGGGTIGFNPAREAITIRNKEYFRKKWMPE
jgi:GT2 family glycosyltransferase